MTIKRYDFVQTSDGSLTISDKLLGENFHSTFGAIAESSYIFIKNGLQLINKAEIKILEIGFGTGLNCLLTAINKNENQKIIYHSIDKFPLSINVLSKLNYAKQLNILQNVFDTIIYHEWEIEKEIFFNFYLKKIENDLINFNSSECYDIIYFDAFSPNVQPELWTTEIFINLYNMLKDGGILTTYSSKGDVKRALREAKFIVKRINGPVGKRHILRALKLNNNK